MKQLSIALFVICIALPSFALPVEWTVASGGNGHFYEPVSTGAFITWDQAKLAAEQAGGHLVTLTSAAENDFVFSLIDEPAYWNPSVNLRGPWIGAYQLPGSVEPDGGWVWVTGEVFSYENWDQLQPNNWNGSENRAHFGNQPGRTNTWNDVSEDYLEVHSYVIEYVPEPMTLCLLAFGGFIIRKRP